MYAPNVDLEKEGKKKILPSSNMAQISGKTTENTKKKAEKDIEKAVVAILYREKEPTFSSFQPFLFHTNLLQKISIRKNLQKFLQHSITKFFLTLTVLTK